MCPCPETGWSFSHNFRPSYLLNPGFEYVSVVFVACALNKPHHEQKSMSGTGRVLEITPVVLEYCLNQIFVEIIMEYDVKWGLAVSVNVKVIRYY